MNCPFYGYALYPSAFAVSPNGMPPFIMFPTEGNQCAMVAGRHAPCRMEQNGEIPDWKECVLVKTAQCKETV